MWHAAIRKRQTPANPAVQKNRQQPNNILAIENIFYPVKSTTYNMRKRKSLKSLRKKIVDKPKNICYTGNTTIEKEEK